MFLRHRHRVLNAFSAMLCVRQTTAQDRSTRLLPRDFARDPAGTPNLQEPATAEPELLFLSAGLFYAFATTPQYFLYILREPHLMEYPLKAKPAAPIFREDQ